MLSSLLSYVGGRSEGAAINIDAVEVHDVEISTDKSGRRLKHLLKLNHAQHSILYNHHRFHNHSPHILGSAYLFKAPADHLNNIYDDICEHDRLEPWEDSPAEIGEHDHREYLSKREYQRAWVDFFEDQLVDHGYDWKAVVKKYIFEKGSASDNPEPMFHCLVAGLGHPLIHLGYAYELNSREIAMEALGLAATCYDAKLASLLTAPPPKDVAAQSPTSDIFEVFSRLHVDARLEGIFSHPGEDNLERLLSTPKLIDILLSHFQSWNITSPTTQFTQSQHLASLLVISTSPKLGGHGYDFFLVHLLTTSHAIRILIPFLPASSHILLVKQWLLITLAIYIAQLRPDLSAARKALETYDLKDRSWDFVDDRALHSNHKYDAHYIKGCRAMKEGAKTWGDKDEWFLKCAVRFADEFDGWGGFGSADLESEEMKRDH